MSKIAVLAKVVEWQKSNIPKGIFCICSANPFVLQASIKKAKQEGFFLLIESTCNQVNQYGGYMHMTPSQFMSYIYSIADKFEFSHNAMIIGGDHLGPNVWKDEPAKIALSKAKQLVADYVAAGYTKIHLDASMACADDDSPLNKLIIARREAELCQIAEETWKQKWGDDCSLVYVVGTEVPVPGGIKKRQKNIEVTSVDEAKETIDITKKTFLSKGLQSAWERVVAFVVQPGVEFGDSQIFKYDRKKASPLSELIENYDHLIYEAHSTDYQQKEALKEMVEDHFAILKVGPALTFTMREAIFALAIMEKEWLKKKPVTLSKVRETLDEVMVENPVHWEKYYRGKNIDQFFTRRYSFSDRSRYYWADPRVEQSLNTLIRNLKNNQLPLSLISQYLPNQYQKVRSGLLNMDPVNLIHDKVIEILEDYIYACNIGN